MIIGVSAFADSTLSKSKIVTKAEFVLLSDVQESEITIFLSYTGIHFDQCGIKVRANNFTRGQDISEILTISPDGSMDMGEITPTALVAKLPNPQSSSHGAFFTIKTKSGQSIAAEVSKVSDVYKVDAFVENLPCDEL